MDMADRAGMQLSMFNDTNRKDKHFIVYTEGGHAFRIQPSEVDKLPASQLHWKNAEGSHWIATDKVVAVSVLDAPPK